MIIDAADSAFGNGLTGFGIQVHPSGIKSFFVNYRTGNGGRKASNKRVVLGRFGRMSPEQARRLAHQALGKVAGGADPAGERAEVRGMPLLKQARRVRQTCVQGTGCATVVPVERPGQNACPKDVR